MKTCTVTRKLNFLSNGLNVGADELKLISSYSYHEAIIRKIQDKKIERLNDIL